MSEETTDNNDLTEHCSIPSFSSENERLYHYQNNQNQYHFHHHQQQHQEHRRQHSRNRSLDSFTLESPTYHHNEEQEEPIFFYQDYLKSNSHSGSSKTCGEEEEEEALCNFEETMNSSSSSACGPPIHHCHCQHHHQHHQHRCSNASSDPDDIIPPAISSCSSSYSQSSCLSASCTNNSCKRTSSGRSDDSGVYSSSGRRHTTESNTTTNEVLTPTDDVVHEEQQEECYKNPVQEEFSTAGCSGKSNPIPPPGSINCCPKFTHTYSADSNNSNEIILGYCEGDDDIDDDYDDPANVTLVSSLNSNNFDDLDVVDGSTVQKTDVTNEEAEGESCTNEAIVEIPTVEPELPEILKTPTPTPIPQQQQQQPSTSSTSILTIPGRILSEGSVFSRMRGGRQTQSSQAVPIPATAVTGAGDTNSTSPITITSSSTTATSNSVGTMMRSRLKLNLKGTKNKFRLMSSTPSPSLTETTQTTTTAASAAPTTPGCHTGVGIFTTVTRAVTTNSISSGANSPPILKVEENDIVTPVDVTSGPPKRINNTKTVGKQHQLQPKSWLLRFFESQVFNMSYAIGYLFSSKEPGVQQYIGKVYFVHKIPGKEFSNKIN